jgi:hypothetical protein
MGMGARRGSPADPDGGVWWDGARWTEEPARRAPPGTRAVTPDLDQLVTGGITACAGGLLTPIVATAAVSLVFPAPDCDGFCRLGWALEHLYEMLAIAFGLTFAGGAIIAAVMRPGARLVGFAAMIAAVLILSVAMIAADGPGVFFLAYAVFLGAGYGSAVALIRIVGRMAGRG